MPPATQFRLIRALPADASAIDAFEQLADAIEARDHCGRIEALQRACDEHPAAFERYCRALCE